MKVSKGLAFWGLAVVLTTAGVASAADDTAAVLGKLHHSNQMEIEMGKLANDQMAPLKAAVGAEVDRAFASAMLEDHTKDVDAAKVARDSTTDAKLKVLLDSTIPVLEKHRDAAQKLVVSLGSSVPPAGKVMAPTK